MGSVSALGKVHTNVLAWCRERGRLYDAQLAAVANKCVSSLDSEQLVQYLDPRQVTVSFLLANVASHHI